MDKISPTNPGVVPQPLAAQSQASQAQAPAAGPADGFTAGSDAPSGSLDSRAAARLVFGGPEEGDRVREIRSRNADAAKEVSFLWGYETDHPIYGRPLAAGGDICFANSDGRVYAVDATNGKLKWDNHFSTTAVQNDAPSLARDPQSGTIYGAAYGGTLNALDPFSGNVRWSTNVGGPLYHAPALGTADGTVVCGTRYGRLLGLSPADGSVKWDLKLGDEISSPPVADARSGNVYATVSGMSREGNFYALDSATGAQRWVFPRGGQAACAPAVDPRDQTVYCGMFNGSVYALDPATGQSRWEFPTGRSILQSPVLDEARDVLYCASSDGKLYALDPSTGQMKWAREMGDGWSRGRAGHPPIVDPKDGTVYCDCEDGSVFAVEPTGGNVKWCGQAGGRVSALQLDAENGTLYFGSADGSFRAVDCASGQDLWKITTGSGILGEPYVDPADGAVYFGGVDGILYALAKPEVCAQRILADKEGRRSPQEPVKTEIVVEDGFVVIGGLRLPRRGQS